MSIPESTNWKRGDFHHLPNDKKTEKTTRAGAHRGGSKASKESAEEIGKGKLKFQTPTPNPTLRKNVTIAKESDVVMTSSSKGKISLNVNPKTLESATGAVRYKEALEFLKNRGVSEKLLVKIKSELKKIVASKNVNEDIYNACGRLIFSNALNMTESLDADKIMKMYNPQKQS